MMRGKSRELWLSLSLSLSLSPSLSLIVGLRQKDGGLAVGRGGDPHPTLAFALLRNRYWRVCSNVSRENKIGAKIVGEVCGHVKR